MPLLVPVGCFAFLETWAPVASDCLVAACILGQSSVLTEDYWGLTGLSVYPWRASQWAPGHCRVLIWSLAFCVPDSTVQIHICMMLLKHFLPVMKYSCSSPKGLQQQIRVSLLCRPPPRMQAICAAERAAVGSTGRSSQIQAADLCL